MGRKAKMPEICLSSEMKSHSRHVERPSCNKLVLDKKAIDETLLSINLQNKTKKASQSRQNSVYR